MRLQTTFPRFPCKFVFYQNMLKGHDRYFKAGKTVNLAQAATEDADNF